MTDPAATSQARVVSLVPSTTETLLALGVVPVGVTRFCDAPGLRTVGGTKNPDIEAIRALRPDIVLMDREENRREDAEALVAAGLRVLATHVTSVETALSETQRIAAQVGADPPGAATVEPPDAPAGEEPVRVWVPIWRRPWMTIGAGTYGTSILAAAGFLNVHASSPTPYPSPTIEQSAALGPDVVLAPSEPYPFSERHREELEQVAPVVFVDGRDLFWWGHRTPAAVTRLRARRRALAAGG